jgi:hypothetical protein
MLGRPAKSRDCLAGSLASQLLLTFYSDLFFVCQIATKNMASGSGLNSTTFGSVMFVLIDLIFTGDRTQRAQKSGSSENNKRGRSPAAAIKKGPEHDSRSLRLDPAMSNLPV